MAIDSRAKRLSAIATRRLPWFRRFWPEADGSMTITDRQQLAFVYIGITVAQAATAGRGLQATVPVSRLHVSFSDAKLHAKVKADT